VEVQEREKNKQFASIVADLSNNSPPNIPLGRGNTAVKDKPNHSPDIRRRTTVFLPPSRHVKFLFLRWYYPYLSASTHLLYYTDKNPFFPPHLVPGYFPSGELCISSDRLSHLVFLNLEDSRTLCERDHDRVSFFPRLVRPFILRLLNDRVYTWWIRKSSTFNRDL